MPAATDGATHRRQPATRKATCKEPTVATAAPIRTCIGKARVTPHPPDASRRRRRSNDSSSLRRRMLVDVEDEPRTADLDPSRAIGAAARARPPLGKAPAGAGQGSRAHPEGDPRGRGPAALDLLIAGVRSRRVAGPATAGGPGICHRSCARRDEPTLVLVARQRDPLHHTPYAGGTRGNPGRGRGRGADRCRASRPAGGSRAAPPGTRTDWANRGLAALADGLALGVTISSCWAVKPRDTSPPPRGPGTCRAWNGLVP